MLHKFGGTSVADAERYKGVAQIVVNQQRSPGTRTAIVVSAMSKVTDALIELVHLAARQDESYLERLEALEQKHNATAAQLSLEHGRREAIVTRLASDFQDVKEVLRGVWVAQSFAEPILEFISGYGELWSAQLLHATLEAQGVSATWLDARQVLIVEPAGPAVNIDWETSSSNIQNWLANEQADFLVITGYIASTRNGLSTTLKRNGSDFSASIFGALLHAESITIWTDVNGVLSADPRLVPDAHVVAELSYQEASELAYFGAKVLHPRTMAPAIAQNIPIWIKNTFSPDQAGTKITAVSASAQFVKGFATIEDMALINVEGTGMIGIPGFAYRLFGALRDVDVSVVMISQASSEHSICFAVPQAQASIAKETIGKAFFAELHHGQIQSVEVTPGCCILAMVGDGMIEQPGMSGGFFKALGQAGVNVRAIAQGSSERNISAVISQHEAKRALRAVHSAFYLSPQTLSIGLIGAGLIGRTFLDQLSGQLHWLRAERGIDLRIRGIMNSRQMVFHDRHIDLESWSTALSASQIPAALDDFVNHVHASHLPHTVIIDATASATVPEHYPEWLARGINIITPNKKGNTSTLERYRALRKIARKSGKYYLYETTVGAGLPVLHTLRDLTDTGDKVLELEGVLSGTLSFIFNSFDGQKSFSEIVREAQALGYTEPDPREDLSGMDVARKLVILAREHGLGLELVDVEVESLVPENLRNCDVVDFLTGLSDYDESWDRRLRAAQARDEVLRYIGKIDEDGKASVTLKAYPGRHVLANLSGSDNLVSFRTARYNMQPMIVRGPGAGPEVTAAGVFADLLRLASFLGAPQ
ncbi:MAG TPA: bifunctional aspartate kinase/homoserine dehydrogenase I [Pyrinomonadaceae bacterium]|nr:bifunctional aspartate kinase/homoserine dehydrogenase I [Pyrinomonadaceae bacterium]